MWSLENMEIKYECPKHKLYLIDVHNNNSGLPTSDILNQWHNHQHLILNEKWRLSYYFHSMEYINRRK